MTDIERTTLQRALLPGYDAPLPLAEALQGDGEPSSPAAPSGWSADRAHARIRLLAGIVGLGGTALIVAILVMGQIAGGSAHG